MNVRGIDKMMSICLLLTLLFIGCTTTITKSKNPLFIPGTDSIQSQLARLVSCENINLDGKETTTNGKRNTELEVDILNGQHIPADDIQMKALGKSIAVVLKQALQDKNEYDTYKVLFVTREKSGGIIKRNWRGDVFKSEEL
jgi:hypothetical protein